MTKEEKAQAQFGITYAMKHIHTIEESAVSEREKAELINVQLLMMLDDVICGLPKALRAQAQACIDVRYHLLSTAIARLYPPQKEASPECLAASDSLS